MPSIDKPSFFNWSFLEGWPYSIKTIHSYPDYQKAPI